MTEGTQILLYLLRVYGGFDVVAILPFGRTKSITRFKSKQTVPKHRASQLIKPFGDAAEWAFET